MLFIEAHKNINKLPEDSIIINTTSRSNNWTQAFSPFNLPGGKLYGSYYSKNVENLWQFSKCYDKHVDKDGNPTKEYFEWATRGWNSSYSYRYPMGRGTKPLYSYWDGEKLGYIDARKKIYVPVYSRACIQTKAFKHLLELYKTTDKDIYLIDFDGYNHKEMGMNLNDVLNNEKRSMGHAFVIYDLLERYKK